MPTDREFEQLKEDGNQIEQIVRKSRNSPTRADVIRNGMGIGSCLAMVISFTTHRSIFWSIASAFLSWLYVIYYAITR